MRAEFYRNLHKNCFSMRVGGRVRGHVTAGVIGGVMFKVSEAGRQRVIREQRKNVHATMSGTVIPMQLSQIPECLRLREISYNPYRGASFFYRDTGNPVPSIVGLVALVGTKIYEITEGGCTHND